MCGIVGVFGDIGFSEKRIAKTMHQLDIVRGADASGIVRIAPDYSTSFIKAPGTPSNLVALDDALANQENTDYEAFFSYHSGLVYGPTLGIIMHNRKATVGGLTQKAAHPFDFPNVIGVHNGTIPQHVYSKMEHYVPSVNDSEALYFEIDKYGVEETYKKYSGAYACVAWNKKTNRLMMWRNSERPLYVKFRKDHGAIMWASEKWMMDEAIYSNRSAIDNWNEASLEVTVNKLFNLRFDEGEVKQSVVDLTPPSTVTTYFPNQTNYRGGYTYGAYPQTPSKEKEETVVKRISGTPPATKMSNIIYGHDAAFDESVCYWWDPSDCKFHLLSDYKTTKDELDGYVFRFDNKQAIAHRYYKPLTVTKLLEKPKPNLHLVKKFANGEVGNRHPDRWLEVTVHADGTAVFFPPEKNGTPYRVVDSLAKYVVERDGKFWLTTEYEFPGEGIKSKKEKEADKEYTGPFGVKYSLDEYETLLIEAGGCCLCSHFPQMEEYHHLEWLESRDEPNFICPDCQGERIEELDNDIRHFYFH